MMEKIIDIKNKIIELIKEQKVLFGISALSVCMVIVIMYLSLAQNNAKKAPNFQLANTRPAISQSPQVSMPKGTISPAGATINSQTSPTVVTLSRTINITISKAPTTTPVQKISPSNKPAGVTPTGQPASVQNTPGTSSQGQPTPTTSANPTAYTAPTTNPTSVPSSGPQIVFINSNGQSQTYIPPDTPPVEITWARYTNQLEHYAIDYPSNWQIYKMQYMKHEAVFIYAPGADVSDPNVQYISYGWSTYFYPPVASYIGSFTLDGVPGTIYTNGSIGSTYIAGVFNYANGFLNLNNNVSDATFAYIFDHMLLSLDFNTP